MCHKGQLHTQATMASRTARRVSGVLSRVDTGGTSSSWAPNAPDNATGSLCLRPSNRARFAGISERQEEGRQEPRRWSGMCEISTFGASLRSRA